MAHNCLRVNINFFTPHIALFYFRACLQARTWQYLIVPNDSIQSQGGAARAKALSNKEKSEIAKNAALARWNLPKAEDTGVLRIGDMSFPCSVLSDETRILTQGDFMKGMGMYYSGWVAKNAPKTGVAVLPHFLAFDSLKPFIHKHLGDLQSIVVKYRTEKGFVAHGIRAEIIPKLCEVWLDADEAIKLGKRQKQIAQRAKTLMRALAHVGIVALVDEATGRQNKRASDALAAILEKFLARELQPWTKTFPLEFYSQIFRLKGWKFDPASVKRPQVISHYTMDFVYARLAPGVLTELKAKNPVVDGRRKHRLFQWLNGEIGHPKLRSHIDGVCVLMRVSDSWDEFRKHLDKAYPTAIEV